MSAHNAWLDVWLQLGIVGVLVFAPIVFVTWHRTWFRAVDQPRNDFGPPLPYATSALWPFLVLVALFVQSLTESRLLIESGWLLLIILAVKTRFDFELPAHTEVSQRTAAGATCQSLKPQVADPQLRYPASAPKNECITTLG